MLKKSSVEDTSLKSFYIAHQLYNSIYLSFFLFDLSLNLSSCLFVYIFSLYISLYICLSISLYVRLSIRLYFGCLLTSDIIYVICLSVYFPLCRFISLFLYMIVLGKIKSIKIKSNCLSGTIVFKFN